MQRTHTHPHRHGRARIQETHYYSYEGLVTHTSHRAMAALLSRAINCDNLWRPWYIIFVTCLQIFMLYSGIARYISFKEHFFDPKYGGNWNSAGMNFYLAMLIIATFFVCLFLYSSLVRGSNLAGEGVALGQELVLYHPGPFHWPQQTQSQQEGSNAGLYATANGVLERGNLSAGLGVVGEEEGVPPFDTWSARSAAHVPPSDFATYPGLPTMFRSMVSTGGTNVTGEKERWLSLYALWRRFQRRFIPTSSLMHIISAHAFLLPLPVLEAQLIFHHVIPFEDVWKSNLNSVLRSSSSNAMSVEFFNLLFAFAALALRYPSVFWRTNHAFAFTFSILLVFLGVHGLLEMNSAEIIVKLCWNDKNFASSQAGLCQAAVVRTSAAVDKVDFLEPAVFEIPAEDPEGLQNATALFLSAFGTITTLLLSSCVFDYGVDQFVDRLAALRRSAIFGPASQDVVPSDTASIQVGGVGGVCGLKSEGQRRRQRTVVWRRLVAVVGALCVLAIKMPILIACGHAFATCGSPLLLANIVATVFFFCVWFIVWFAFCLKPEWKFKQKSRIVYKMQEPVDSQTETIR
ncbi:Protein tincar [Taenia solium]|eukprot:TsM_000502900 transcript=TsM_000502900 gene=TsM_000502900